MNDMDKAVNRLNKAMGAKERIMIYGDYDVDGVTAVALVYKYLQNYYSNVEYYIPTRYEEGYGISRQHLRLSLLLMRQRLIIPFSCHCVSPPTLIVHTKLTKYFGRNKYHSSFIVIFNSYY